MTPNEKKISNALDSLSSAQINQLVINIKNISNTINQYMNKINIPRINNTILQLQATYKTFLPIYKNFNIGELQKIISTANRTKIDISQLYLFHANFEYISKELNKIQEQYELAEEIIRDANTLSIEVFIKKHPNIPSKIILHIISLVDKNSQKNVTEKIEDEANKKVKSINSARAKHAVNTKHEKTRKMKKEIQAIWLTGKYSSKDLCAEQEYEALGFKSYGTARKALYKLPNPKKQ